MRFKAFLIFYNFSYKLSLNIFWIYLCLPFFFSFFYPEKKFQPDFLQILHGQLHFFYIIINFTSFCIYILLFHGKNCFQLEFEFSKFHRIKYGICLPRTCSYDHIETALNNYLNRTIGNEPSYITLKKESCSSKEALPLKGTDWLAV